MDSMTKPQGSLANASGNILEQQVKTVFQNKGFQLASYREWQKSPEKYGVELLLTNVPYTTIYDHPGHTEFLAKSEKYKFEIRIECKWQQSAGSVDEKLVRGERDPSGDDGGLDGPGAAGRPVRPGAAMNGRYLPAAAGVAALLLAGTAAGAEFLHTEKSLYRNIFVYEEDGLRCMKFGRYSVRRQTCVSLSARGRPGFDYARMMMASLYLNPAPQRVLITSREELHQAVDVAMRVARRTLRFMHRDLAVFDLSSIDATEALSRLLLGDRQCACPVAGRRSRVAGYARGPSAAAAAAVPPRARAARRVCRRSRR